MDKTLSEQKQREIFAIIRATKQAPPENYFRILKGKSKKTEDCTISVVTLSVPDMQRKCTFAFDYDNGKDFVVYYPGPVRETKNEYVSGFSEAMENFRGWLTAVSMANNPIINKIFEQMVNNPAGKIKINLDNR